MLDKNLAILVVESDANRQSWITSTLELLGCKSTTTNSIADAIAAITEKRFDLVLFNQNCSTAQFDLLVDAVESQRYPFHKPTLLAALGNKHTDLSDHLTISNLTGRLTYPSTINTVGKTIEHWLDNDDSIPGALTPDGYNGFSYKLNLDISAISNPGKGKTTATNRQTSLTAAAQEKLAKISLLLVDDDPISLEIGRDQLEDAAFDVKTADSAAEAISSICQQLPDLVIVNEDLADISGYQLYRQIRGLDQGKKLAIILLTNNLSSSHEKQPDSSSFTDYLSKPTDWKLLTIRIKKMLQAIRTESSLSTTQQQFHNLQKLANVGYADFNFETQQGYTSEGFWVTIGHQPNGAFSIDDFIQVIHPEDRNRYRESVKSSSKNANQIKTQYRVIDANGNIREILTTRQTVLNENGNPANFASTFQDITGQDDHQKIRRLSKYDHLTGFYNPVSFRV
ncbi:MAG: response regulator, partial [Gammaproteobacteria bacterium]|nr:response regulator [Gammaproteobacteria bacterium]